LLEKEAKRVTFAVKDGAVKMEYLDQGLIKKQGVTVDVAFPVVHGTNCEDGSIQGFFELLGLPYVGCDVMSSALGMDKVLFKNVLHDRAIPVLPCVDFSAREWSANRKDILAEVTDKLSYPMIVKPSNLGSSVGISKVENEKELISAVDLACSFAHHILIEHAIENLREINCSVLGDRDDCAPSALEEPVMHDKILSYDDDE
jgi:D-alanine-D-alanine ligase